MNEHTNLRNVGKFTPRDAVNSKKPITQLYHRRLRSWSYYVLLFKVIIILGEIFFIYFFLSVFGTSRFIGGIFIAI